MGADPPPAGPVFVAGMVCLSQSWPPAPQRLSRDSTLRPGPTPEPARLESSSSANTAVNDSEPGGPDLSRAVLLMDLDVLYSQAMCAHPLLVDKVRNWAVACQGRFPGLLSRVGGGVLLFSPPTEGSSAAIRWARVKSVGRSIEKVRRCYDQVHFFKSNSSVSHSPGFYIGHTFACRQYSPETRNNNCGTHLNC